MFFQELPTEGPVHVLVSIFDAEENLFIEQKLLQRAHNLGGSKDLRIYI